MSGIGTRAIVEINQAASQFESSIVLRIDNKFIDVKSILGLTFTLISNNEYVLEIHGADKEEASRVMTDIFDKHGLLVRVQ
jgi:phosphocarrier protein HPr